MTYRHTVRSFLGGGTCIATLITLAMAADAGAQSLEQYRVYDLGPILDGPRALAFPIHFSINDSAEAVFHSFDDPADDQTGFVWLPQSAYGLSPLTRYDIGALAGTSDDTLAIDINDDGIIAGGIGEPGAEEAIAFTLGSGAASTASVIFPSTTGGGTPVAIGDPSLAFGVGPSSSPLIVGAATMADGCFGGQTLVGFQWTHGDVNGYLLSFVGGNFGPQILPYSTNGSDSVGWAHGCSQNFPCNSHIDALTWDAPTTFATEIDGFVSGSTRESVAYRINAAGNIVGHSRLSTCSSQHAAFWSDATQSPYDLGDPTIFGVGDPAVINGGLVSGENTSAIGVNDATNVLQVVGNSDDVGYALLWADDGSGGFLMTSFDVNDLAGENIVPECSIDDAADDHWVSFDEFHDVNDCGWIIGWGERSVDGTNERRAFLMIPVDDPQRAAADFAGPNPDCDDCAQYSVCAQCWIDCPDGVVNEYDEAAMLDHWASCAAPCPYNLDGAGRVDSADLLILYQRWGVINSCIAGELPGEIEGFAGGSEPEGWNDPFGNDDIAVVMSNFDITTPADLATFLDTADAGMIEALNVMLGAIAEEDE